MTSYDIHLIQPVDLKNADGETVSVRRIETGQYTPRSSFVKCVPTNLYGTRPVRDPYPGWHQPLDGIVTLTIPVENIAIIDEYQD